MRSFSDENRTRIYFSITENGRLYLRRLIDEYREFTQAVEEILKTQFPLTPFRMRNALWPSVRGRSLVFQPYNRPFRPNTAITSSRFMGRSGLVPSTTPSAVAFAQCPSCWDQAGSATVLAWSSAFCSS